jgi:hypothetical protein
MGDCRQYGYLVAFRLQIHTKFAHDLGGRHTIWRKYQGKDYYICQSMAHWNRIDEIIAQICFFHTFRFT